MKMSMSFVNEKSGILFWSLSSCSPKLKLKIENDKFCGLYSSFFLFFSCFHVFASTAIMLSVNH